MPFFKIRIRDSRFGLSYFFKIRIRDSGDRLLQIRFGFEIRPESRILSNLRFGFGVNLFIMDRKNNIILLKLSYLENVLHFYSHKSRFTCVISETFLVRVRIKFFDLPKFSHILTISHCGSAILFFCFLISSL